MNAIDGGVPRSSPAARMRRAGASGRSSSVWSPIIWRMGLFVATMVAPARGEDATGEAVLLPPLMIEENAGPLPWRYASLPGMELISVCDDDVTREYVRRVHQLDQLLAVLVPIKFQAKFSVPEAQILFNEKLGRARSREVMAEMLRRVGLEKALDQPVLPASMNTGPFSRRMEFLPNLSLSDIDAVAGFTAVRESDTRRMTFTFDVDRIRFVLERRVPALPIWLVEGMVALVERAAFLEDTIEFEPAGWSTDEEARLLRNPEHPRTLWPMQELLAVRQPDAGDKTAELEKIWRAQCALFLRWALVKEGDARKNAFWTLVERLEREPLSEKLLKDTLGLGFADLRDRLSDYLPEAVRKDATLRAGKLAKLPELTLRTPTDVEVARIRGDWERMEIRFVKRRFPELTASYVEQARRTLRKPYEETGSRDPGLLAVLALTECDVGNAAGAREFLELAMKGGVNRPRIYLELAKLRFDEAWSKNNESKLSPQQVAEVLEPLQVMYRLEPRLVQAYALTTEVWNHAVMPPTAGEVAEFGRGVRYFPQMSPLILRAIYFSATSGLIDEARELADLGWNRAGTDEMRDRFGRVRQELAGMEPRRGAEAGR